MKYRIKKVGDEWLVLEIGVYCICQSKVGAMVIADRRNKQEQKQGGVE